jgi:hypothetical protein
MIFDSPIYSQVFSRESGNVKYSNSGPLRIENFILYSNFHPAQDRLGKPGERVESESDRHVNIAQKL